MTQATPIAFSLLAATMGFVGFVGGLAYFAALRRTVVLVADGRGRLVPTVLTLGRLSLTIIALGLAAKLGATSLLAMFIGFLLARTVALRAARSSD